MKSTELGNMSLFQKIIDVSLNCGFGATANYATCELNSMQKKKRSRSLSALTK